jgi:hypothetical protein
VPPVSSKSSSTLQSFVKLKRTQTTLDALVASLFSAIGISTIFMSPVGVPFIIAASILLAGTISTFGVDVGRLLNNRHNLHGLIAYAPYIAHMLLTGSGVVIATLTLLTICGTLSLPPILNISLLCAMAMAMVGVTVVKDRVGVSRS